MKCCFCKIHFLGWSISCDCTELLTSHGSYVHQLFFTQTERFLPPHWSRAVVYEIINHSTENTICFSLWDKGKLSMVCETESIPAFVENVCYFIKTTKKKTQMDNYICVFGLLLWFCLYNCLGASWSRTKKRNEEGGVLPFFFLFYFFYFVLSLSLSPSFAQNLDRKRLLRRLSRNGIKIYLRWRGYRACDKRITSFTPLVLPVWVQEGNTNSFSGVIEPMHLYPPSLGQ